LIEPLLLGRAVLIAACAAACWLDGTKRIIPNWLCVLTLAAGLGFSAWAGGLGALGWHGLHAGVALLAGMALFATGVIGGGDAKFYAAVAAWFAWSDGFRLLFCVSIAALAMFALWFVIRRLRGIPVLRRAEDDSGKFPYALGIGGGAILALFA
jgi:prepilin peptidase CpaA